MSKFDFWEAMEADGVKPCPEHSGHSDDRFFYRMAGSDVQVAIREHFDRWANSVDFAFSMPKTPKAYEKVKARLEAAMKAGDYDPGLGEGRRL
jgi:hypothetical protein